MKFTIQRKNFIDAMNYAVYAVENKPMLPVLACVIIDADAENKKLTLSCCNMQHKVQVTIDADVEISGKAAVPAKKLLSLLKSFRGSDVFCDCDENKINIKGGTTEVTLVGLNADEFPEINDFTPEYMLTIDKEQAKKIIKQGGYAFGKDDARKVLTGCCMEIDSNTVSVVSTDGKRLALSSIATDKGSDIVRQYVIPFTALNYVANLPADKITFIFNSKMIAVQADNIFYSTKLIEGTFPNYRQVIPQNFKHEILVDAEEFISKLQTVSVMADDTACVDLDIDAASIKFTIQNSAEGVLTDSMETDGGPDAVLRMTFNPSILLTTLNSAGVTGQILLCLNDSYSQAELRFDSDTLAILMPIRRK